MELPKVGTYAASIVSGVLGTSKAGKPQVVVTIEVTHIANGENWAEIAPFQRRLFWSFSENAAEYTYKKLERVGFQGNFDTMTFSEHGVVVECRHETYENKVGDKWELEGSGGGEIQPADQKTIMDLNARWKNRHGAPKPTGKPAAPPARAAAPPAATAGKFPQPEGEAPDGRTWDSATGQWVPF